MCVSGGGEVEFLEVVGSPWHTHSVFDKDTKLDVTSSHFISLSYFVHCLSRGCVISSCG